MDLQSASKPIVLDQPNHPMARMQGKGRGASTGNVNIELSPGNREEISANSREFCSANVLSLTVLGGETSTPSGDKYQDGGRSKAQYTEQTDINAASTPLSVVGRGRGRISRGRGILKTDSVQHRKPTVGTLSDTSLNESDLYSAVAEGSIISTGETSHQRIEPSYLAGRGRRWRRPSTSPKPSFQVSRPGIRSQYDHPIPQHGSIARDDSMHEIKSQFGTPRRALSYFSASEHAQNACRPGVYKPVRGLTFGYESGHESGHSYGNSLGPHTFFTPDYQPSHFYGNPVAPHGHMLSTPHYNSSQLHYYHSPASLQRPTPSRPVNQLQYGHPLLVPNLPDGQNGTNELILTSIPETVDEQHLQHFLSVILGVDGFIGKIVNCSTTLTLSKSLSNEETDGFIKEIERHPIEESSCLRVFKQLPKTQKALEVNRLEESGDRELCSDFEYDTYRKETTMESKHPQVSRRTVLSKDHKIRFHEDVKPPAQVTEPHKVKLHPFLGSAINNQSHKLKLKKEFQNLNVQLAVEIQSDNATIILTPFSNTPKNEWQSCCENYIRENYSNCEIQTHADDIHMEMLKKYWELEKSDEAVLVCEQLDKNSFRIAGDVALIKSLKDYQKTIISSTEESMVLNGWQFDFFEQVTATKVKNKYPDVTFERHRSDFKLVLKGLCIHVQQSKKELTKIFEDLQVVQVSLDPTLAHCLSSSEGRNLLQLFIQSQKCPIAYSFNYTCLLSKVSSQDTLAFVCEPLSYDWASTIPKTLVSEIRYEIVPIPDCIVAHLNDMKDHEMLKQKLNGYKPTFLFEDFSNKITTVCGFSTAVSACTTDLKSFFQSKTDNLAPLSIAISQTLCMVCKKQEKQLRQMLSEDCQADVILEFSDDESQIVLSVSEFTESDWKNQGKKTISSVTSQYSVSQLSIANENKQKVSAFLEEYERTPDGVFFAFSWDDNLVDIAVNHKLDRELQSKINDCHVITKRITLEAQQYTYLKQVQSQKIKKIHKGVTITFKEDNKYTVIANGSKAEVVYFTDSIDSYLEYSTVPLTADILISDYLFEVGKDFIDKFLKEESSPPIALFFKKAPGRQLLFLCDTMVEASVTVLVNKLKDQVDFQEISLPPCLNNKTDSNTLWSQFKDLLNKLESRFKIVCSLNNEIVAFAGLHGDTKGVRQEIEEFIKKKCAITQQLDLEQLQLKLLLKNRELVDKLKTIEVEINQDLNPSSIILKGDMSKVTEALAFVQQLVKSIVKIAIPVRAAGAYRLFRDHTTKDTVIPGIEGKHNVCINILPLVLNMSEPSSMNIHVKEYCHATLNLDNTIRTFRVYIGDLTECRVDVIVNPANEKLHHYAGLAATIVKKGGHEIQEDCNEYIKSKCNDLREGDVYFSRVSGHLPCKAIVHAVGPRWRENIAVHKHEESCLATTVMKSLTAAQSYQSIAFPAISSGIFRYPLPKCASVHIETSICFFHKKTGAVLTDVSFVVIDEHHAKEFKRALSQYLPESVVSTDLTTTCTLPAEKSGDIKQPAVNNSAAPITRAPSRKRRSHRLPSLYQGDLFIDAAASDMYACPSNANLDLSMGVIAKKILQMAGSSLQEECNKRAPMKTGDVVVTGSARLKCRHLLFANIPRYSQDKKGEILRSSLRKCFKECERQHVNSIALPSIGAGALEYPIGLVADIMISESCTFLSKCQSSSFKVNLVIFEAKVYEAFQRELIKAQGSLISSSLGSSTVTRGKTKTAVPLSLSQVRVTPMASIVPMFSINGLHLILVKDDITKYSSDAIVNTTSQNIDLSSSGQVSLALLKIAGKNLQDLCTAAVKREGPLTEGNVISTETLKPLKCKSIFHVFFRSNDPVSYVATIEACLNRGEQQKYKTIAFPAIGSGVQKYPPAQAAEGIVKAVSKFSLSSPKHLQEIHLVIYQQSVYDEFLSLLTRLQDQETLSGNESNESDDFSSLHDSDSSLSDTLTMSNDEKQSSDNTSTYELSAISMDIENEHELIFGNGLKTENPFPAVGKSSSDYTNSTYEVSERPVDIGDGTTFDDTPKTAKPIPAKLMLEIIGFEKEHVDKATDDLYNLVGDNCKEIRIEENSIKALDKKSHQKLYDDCRSLEVECRIEPDNGLIILNGHVHDIHTVKDEVHSLLHNITAKKSQKDLKELKQTFEINRCFTLVKWQFMISSVDDEGFKDYDKRVSYMIEQAFKEFEANKLKKTFKYTQKPHNFTVDFEKQTLQDNKNKTMTRVRRYDVLKEAARIGKHPDRWENVPEGIRVKCFDLDPTCSEYKNVLELFEKTMEKGKNYSSIFKIQRIQNPGLYALYQEKKKEMKKANPRIQNERKLFHGTNADSTEKINANGFNRTFAGKNAKVYGVGTYFALDASYSAKSIYSVPDGNKRKHVYLALVLVGEYTVGKEDMATAPPKDKTKDSTILFDSLVNRPDDPTIFVIGPDAQSYPEYLIIFQ